MLCYMKRYIDIKLETAGIDSETIDFLSRWYWCRLASSYAFGVRLTLVGLPLTSLSHEHLTLLPFLEIFTPLDLNRREFFDSISLFYKAASQVYTFIHVWFTLSPAWLVFLLYKASLCWCQSRYHQARWYGCFGVRYSAQCIQGFTLELVVAYGDL